MIAFICLSIASFATTWGPAASVVFGEVSPPDNPIPSDWPLNGFDLIIAVITPYLVGTNPGDANLGAKVFFIWGGLCCVSLVFAYFLVPEIKGLSLKRVDKMLEEVPPRQGSKWVPHSTFAGEMGLADAKEDVQAENAEDVKL